MTDREKRYGQLGRRRGTGHAPSRCAKKNGGSRATGGISGHCCFRGGSKRLRFAALVSLILPVLIAVMQKEGIPAIALSQRTTMQRAGGGDYVTNHNIQPSKANGFFSRAKKTVRSSLRKVKGWVVPAERENSRNYERENSLNDETETGMIAERERRRRTVERQRRSRMNANNRVSPPSPEPPPYFAHQYYPVAFDSDRVSQSRMKVNGESPDPPPSYDSLPFSDSHQPNPSASSSGGSSQNHNFHSLPVSPSNSDEQDSVSSNPSHARVEHSGAVAPPQPNVDFRLRNQTAATSNARETRPQSLPIFSSTLVGSRHGQTEPRERRKTLQLKETTV